MLKCFPVLLTAAVLCYSGALSAHCQMPCGIYHDDMVYDQLDQYVETMYKAVSVLEDSKFSTARERGEFVRWINQKEIQSDDAARLILTYFLQQKIKPGEADTAKRLESAHKLLFMIVGIKQNVDKHFVEDFNDEWEKFKLMFHIEGYQCKIETLKAHKLQQEQAAEKSQSHDHDHDHDHDQNSDHKH